MSFINSNKNIELLPQIEEIALHPLQAIYLRIRIITTILFYGFFLLLLVAFYFINKLSLPVNQVPIPDELFYGLCAFLFLLMFVSGIMKIWGFKYKAYGLRDEDILYRRGLIWRTETIVPFNRIQHVEIGQGPLERYFNIAKLKVFTAGGSASDLMIPGLKFDDAASMKEYLLSKTKINE